MASKTWLPGSQAAPSANRLTTGPLRPTGLRSGPVGRSPRCRTAPAKPSSSLLHLSEGCAFAGLGRRFWLQLRVRALYVPSDGGGVIAWQFPVCGALPSAVRGADAGTGAGHRPALHGGLGLLDNSPSWALGDGLLLLWRLRRFPPLLLELLWRRRDPKASTLAISEKPIDDLDDWRALVHSCARFAAASNRGTSWHQSHGLQGWTLARHRQRRWQQRRPLRGGGLPAVAPRRRGRGRLATTTSRGVPRA
mmetsp:Transcript_14974/g.41419  ORF Transcript_14974/g.41419 Transcript_14974/m.41419 type:complete len:250 (-) Transcript_14974:1172-1921(-)